MLSCPQCLKWNAKRHVALNLLGAIGYILYCTTVISIVVLFAFISAIIGLALKS